MLLDKISALLLVMGVGTVNFMQWGWSASPSQMRMTSIEN